MEAFLDDKNLGENYSILAVQTLRRKIEEDEGLEEKEGIVTVVSHLWEGEGLTPQIAIFAAKEAYTLSRTILTERGIHIPSFEELIMNDATSMEEKAVEEMKAE